MNDNFQRHRDVTVHPGQRVVTTHGDTRVVAFATPEGVWCYGPRGLELCAVVCDAWGGEHDLAIGLDAA